MTGHLKTSKLGIFDCDVISVKNLIGNIYLMRLSCPEIAQSAIPGQFVNIKVNDQLIPLLRKPFSICRRNIKEGWIEVLWKVIGLGTKIMSGYHSADRINIVGPLGRGYRTPPNLKTALLVGGGLGVAPLPFLCSELLEKDKNTQIFLGAKSAGELSMIDVFEDLGVEIFISTEDGSVGKQGLVTEILIERLEQMDSFHGVGLYSCGPNPFLNAMMLISEEYQIPGQVAIETMMGCGFGICVGCPVRVKNSGDGAPYKLTCVDGPVFKANEILLDG